MAWQYEGSGFLGKPHCCLCQSLPTLQVRASGLWPLGGSLDLRCRSHRVVLHGLSPSSPKLSIFSVPAPTYRSPCTEPFDGFRSTFGHSSGFTTDSRAPESTVISRYQTRSPSFSTELLSMDMLLIVTVFSSTSSGSHTSHAATFNWYFVRSTFSLTGDVVLGSCNWQMLAVYAQYLTHRTNRDVH